VIPGASSRPAAAIAALLKQRGQTLAIAESSAGGLINAALVAVPGASAYYLGGVVIYTPQGRAALLGLTREDVGDIRSATEAFARLLAKRVRANLGATWGLAETGASGPTGNRYGDASGHACIAVAGPAEAAITLETGSADREANMWTFTREALELLEKVITSLPPARLPAGREGVPRR
jgi:nicotinamide-nucleotide amidase